MRIEFVCSARVDHQRTCPHYGKFASRRSHDNAAERSCAFGSAGRLQQIEYTSSICKHTIFTLLRELSINACQNTTHFLLGSFKFEISIESHMHRIKYALHSVLMYYMCLNSCTPTACIGEGSSLTSRDRVNECIYRTQFNHITGPRPGE